MHVLSGQLRKPPFFKKLDGDKGCMWSLELAEVIKDRQTGEKQYTNYKALLFAKAQGQIDFYQSNLAQGAFVVVNCDKLKVDRFQTDSGELRITLMMENARLMNVSAPQGQQPAGQQGGFNQGGFNQGGQQGGFNQGGQQGGFNHGGQQGGFNQPTQGGFNQGGQQGGYGQQ